MEFENVVPYVGTAVLAIFSSILIVSLRRGNKKGAEINHNSPEPQTDIDLPRNDRDLRQIIFRGGNRGTMRSRPSRGNKYRP